MCNQNDTREVARQAERRFFSHSLSAPGIGWYRASFTLSLPSNMAVPIGLHIADATYHYRALIFVNGWLIGRYWNTVGPQNTFYLPAGILNTRGTNDVAIAVWGLDAPGGGLGQVSLTSYGQYTQ
ncbi:MAG TPA: beta galactosidase jelly roll domain-containing protein [Ktedonobacteraceae bacterium]|nr:beta galactosidase jelly roll domain-containing protein [Ktedonobacteraceae bacterium]